MGTSRKKESCPRDREKGRETLVADYFAEEPKFNEDIFRHRFRMSKRLFLKIVSDVQANNSWFQEGLDGRMKKSFTPLQKVTSAIKQLATGNPPDKNDEYLNMAERTSHECLDYFYEATLQSTYIDQQATASRFCIRLMRIYITFLGCWVVLIVHTLFGECVNRVAGPYMRGITGSQNDINVLHQSPLFLTPRNGTAPKCPFYVNNPLYKHGSYLTDGIYPTWPVVVKSFPYPHIVKEKKFKRQHEAARKDVERAFGVLKAKWDVLNRPMRAMSVKKIRNIVYACIIMHNMILKDDGNVIAPVHIRDPPVEPVFDENVYNELVDEDTDYRLKCDLVEHLGEQDLPHLLADSDDD